MPFLPEDRRERMALLSLPLLVALVYAIAFPGQFFMDDTQIVLENLLVYTPELKVVLTSDYWGPGENSGLYRPLTILSFALNYKLFGEHAWGYLLVNLLLHCGVSTLLFFFLRRLGATLLVSWFAAALFAVHPLHGEAVIQLVGRSELLVALFVLLAMIVARTSGKWNDLLIVLCYLGAILAKEHGVILLALIPAVDLYCERLTWNALLRRRGLLLATLVVVTVLWLLYRHFVVHGHIPAPDSLDPYYVPFASVDAPTRILSALKLQLLYLAKLAVPYHLQGMYPRATVVPYLSWFSLAGLLVVATVIFSLGVCIVGWKRHALWGLAMVLYLISFAPTANIFMRTGFTMAERVAYLPSLWYCVAAASVLAGIVAAINNKQLVGVMLGTLLTLYALTGLCRFYDFRSLERYWLHDLQVNAKNELSLLMLANYYRGVGRKVEAEVRAKELTTLAPDFKEGLSLYAMILVENGKPQQALRLAQSASKLEQPGAAFSVKIPLAAAYLALGRVEDALATLQVVRSNDRNQPVYWELYGKALEAQGDLVGALACYQTESSRSGGRSNDGLRRLGMVLAKLGRFAEAENHLRRDVRINPKAADGWNALGIALVAQGKAGEAGQAFAKAVELKPESMEYRANLQRSQER